MTTSFNSDILLSLKIVKERRKALVGKIFGFPLVLLSLFQGSEASPTLHNPRGLFRVLSAEIHEEGSVLIALTAENFKYRRTDICLAVISYDPLRTGRLDITYSPLQPIEIYGVGLRIQERDRWWKQDRSGFGDLELGVKIGEVEGGLFKIGVMGYGILPTGKDGFSNGSSQWGGRGLMTFDLSKREGLAPLRFHGNIGYNGNNRGREDELLLGLGIELPTLLFTPMIELTSEQDLDHSFFENPIRFTSGIRFLTPFGPVFDLGYDVNLSKEAGFSKIEPHDWSLLLGIQFETSLQLFTPNAGTITGKVTDSETGEPLSASLVLLREEGIDEGSDPKTGLFTFKKIGPGLKTLQVTLKGYKRKILPVFVKRGETTVRDVSLVKSEEPNR